jgi:hypothetical protein
VSLLCIVHHTSTKHQQQYTRTTTAPPRHSASSTAYGPTVYSTARYLQHTCHAGPAALTALGNARVHEALVPTAHDPPSLGQHVRLARCRAVGPPAEVTFSPSCRAKVHLRTSTVNDMSLRLHFPPRIRVFMRHPFAAWRCRRRFKLSSSPSVRPFIFRNSSPSSRCLEQSARRSLASP